VALLHVVSTRDLVVVRDADDEDEDEDVNESGQD
jgi:hypothetical protein